MKRMMTGTRARRAFAFMILSAWFGLTPAPTRAQEKAVTLIVRVPADAQVEVQGQKTKQTGAVRRFDSPPLAVGRDYTYTLKATWKEAGQEKTREVDVTVVPGETKEVDLTVASEPAMKQAPAKPAGFFTLIVPEVGLTLKPGEKKTLEVRIKRDHFTEPIKLVVTGLPAQVTAAEATVPADKDSVELEVAAAAAAVPGTAKLAVAASAGAQRQQVPLELTVSRPPAVLRLDVPASLDLQAGSRKAIAIKVSRLNFEGPVKVTAAGLPADVAVPPVTIAPDESEATLELIIGRAFTARSVEVTVLATGGTAKAEGRIKVAVEPPPAPKPVEVAQTPPKPTEPKVETPSVPPVKTAKPEPETPPSPVPPAKPPVVAPAPPSKPTPPAPEPATPAVKPALTVDTLTTLVLQPTGYKKLLKVKVLRDGFAGPVTVTFAGLPDGAAIKELVIPADKSEAYAETSVDSSAGEAEQQVKVIGTADKLQAETTINVKIKK